MKNKERIHIAEKMIEMGLGLIRHGADVLDDAEMEVEQRAAEMVKSGFTIGDRVHAKYPNAWWGQGTIVNIDMRPALKPLIVKCDDSEGTIGHFHFDQIEKDQAPLEPGELRQQHSPQEKRAANLATNLATYSAAKKVKEISVDEALAPTQAKAGRPPNDQDLLKAAFNSVCDPDDWKAPIDAFVPIELLDRDLVERAIIHFTATTPTFAENGSGDVHVTAAGYREGPAGP